MVSKEPPSWEITLRKKQSKVYLRGQGKNLTHIIKKHLVLCNSLLIKQKYTFLLI